MDNTETDSAVQTNPNPEKHKCQGKHCNNDANDKSDRCKYCESLIQKAEDAATSGWY